MSGLKTCMIVGIPYRMEQQRKITDEKHNKLKNKTKTINKRIVNRKKWHIWQLKILHKMENETGTLDRCKSFQRYVSEMALILKQLRLLSNIGRTQLKMEQKLNGCDTQIKTMQ